VAKVKINKQFIKSLSPLEENETQKFYWDSTLSGFGLRLGKTKTAFICEKRIEGKTVRVTLGSYPQITPEFAREEAKKALSKMTVGLNPTSEKRAQRSRSITLESAFSDFLEDRNSLKERTVEDYKANIDKAFSDWKSKRLVDINRDMISNRHKLLFKKHGAAQANLCMRILRSIFNFSQGSYFDEKEKPLITDNPVEVLTKKRSWYKVARRDRVIALHRLGDWFKAVHKLHNEVTRDFLLTLLLSGMRRTEASKLKKEDISLEGKSFKVIDPKNSKPLSLPLPPALLEIFERRAKASPNAFLFPGSGKNGHIADPKKAIQSVRKSTGIAFSSHDLRRSYITIASNLVTEHQLKLLVNHSTGGDVTAGYIVPILEELRQPMGKVVSKIMKLCTKEPAKIIKINEI
jgi:integrase